jgi:hypothetical protein
MGALRRSALARSEKGRHLCRPVTGGTPVLLPGVVKAGGHGGSGSGAGVFLDCGADFAGEDADRGGVFAFGHHARGWVGRLSPCECASSSSIRLRRAERRADEWLPSLGPLQRGFQSLADVALIWDAVSARGGANGTQQLRGDS